MSFDMKSEENASVLSVQDNDSCRNAINNQINNSEPTIPNSTSIYTDRNQQLGQLYNVVIHPSFYLEIGEKQKKTQNVEFCDVHKIVQEEIKKLAEKS